jgi:hypothetical protein
MKEPRLLPHERWFVAIAARRQRQRISPRNALLQQGFGPEGMRLYGAALIDGMIGQAVIIGSLLVMTALQTESWVVPYTPGGVGVLLLAFGLLRMRQARRAGRAFRAAAHGDATRAEGTC